MTIKDYYQISEIFENKSSLGSGIDINIATILYYSEESEVEKLYSRY